MAPRYQVLTTLPPGTGGRTRLALQLGAQGFQRPVVMRAIAEGVVPQATAFRTAGALPLLDVVDLDGSDWAVYEFVPGATLKEVLDVHQSVGRLPSLGLVVRVVVDGARALHELHAFKDPLGRAPPFRHGGLSDSALLLGFDGHTRVLDLGARRLSRFIAPEVTRGDRFDVRADAFSLAAVLHSALTGFAKGYAGVVTHAPSPAELPPPSDVHPEATPELDLVVMKALLPDPASRPATLLELAERLELALGPQLLEHDQVQAALQPLFGPRIEKLRAIFATPMSTDLIGPERDHLETAATALPVPGKKPLLPWTIGDDTAAPAPLGGDLSDVPTNAGQRVTNPRLGPIPEAARRTHDEALAEITDQPTEIRPSNPGLGALRQPSAKLEVMVGDDDLVPSGPVAEVGGSTTAEKRAAVGQESVSTADLEPDQAALVRGEVSGVVTDVKKRPHVDVRPAFEPIDSQDVPPPKPRGSGRALPDLDDEPTSAPRPRRHLLRRTFLVLLVLAVGGGAGVAKLRPDLVEKLRARLDALPPVRPQPVVDAGVAAQDDADAGEELADAGQESDAGEAVDAGQAADAGRVADAGHASDAGSGGKKPPAKAVKKKKRP